MSLLLQLRATLRRVLADHVLDVREAIYDLGPLAARLPPGASEPAEEFLKVWAGHDAIEPPMDQALHDLLQARGYPVAPQRDPHADPNQVFATAARGNVGTPDKVFGRLLALTGASERLATIAICDMGINPHPELSDNLAACGGKDFLDHDDDPSSPTGDWHGTVIAGIATAGTDRIRFIPVRARGAEASSVSQTVEAIQWAIDHGARVVNMSFPAEGKHDAGCMRKLIADHPEVLFVAAAGNSPVNLDAVPEQESMQASVFPNLVDVAGADIDGKPWSQTSFGPKKVLLAARSVEVMSTVPGGGYNVMGGTSVAAPAVVCAAAKCLVLDPQLTPAALKVILAETSRKAPAWDGVVGAAGTLDSDRAVTVAALTGLMRSGLSSEQAARRLGLGSEDASLSSVAEAALRVG